jgi:hypothetical protein
MPLFPPELDAVVSSHRGSTVGAPSYTPGG